MGYSCTAIASFVVESMMVQLQAAHGDCGGSSNSWGDPARFWFAEQGRENEDGAITGTVYGPGRTDGTCRRVGPYKVSADGKVIRWPTSTADQRRVAEVAGEAKYTARFGPLNKTYTAA